MVMDETGVNHVIRVRMRTVTVPATIFRATLPSPCGSEIWFDLLKFGELIVLPLAFSVLISRTEASLCACGIINAWNALLIRLACFHG
jgi:hypothetical protein